MKGRSHDRLKTINGGFHQNTTMYSVHSNNHFIFILEVSVPCMHYYALMHSFFDHVF